jgi:outer membrane protein assembly factor BamB
MRQSTVSQAIPVAAAVLAAGLLVHWLMASPMTPLMEIRLPKEDASLQVAAAPVDIRGELRNLYPTGGGKPGELAGSWRGFRGDGRDNVSVEPVRLKRDWSTAPKKLWEIETGEGYAGAAVEGGCVYFLDYDTHAQADALRCLSTDDGKEIWRRSYKVETGRNHGISRTVCAVADGMVVSLGPKCHVLCVDVRTGDFKWGIDLVRDFGTTVPPWYAGQNPLIEEGKVILAPGGSALLMAVDLATGSVIWQTPNPQKWEMTHSSVLPMMFQGRKMYVYCASAGVVGVWAQDGSVAFTLPDWRVSMANVPTPLPIPGDRIFFTGGYGAGSMMVQLEEHDGKVSPKVIFRLPPEVFGAEQQTPIFYKGDIYGVIPVRAELVCLGLDGKVKWASGAKNRFGLGSYLIADGCILAFNDTGTLSLVEATPDEFRLLTQAKLFEHGDECWGPMAIVQGRLFARDMTRLACFDLRE